MATLLGTKPQDTYGNLLQIPNSNNGVDATLRTVQDGKGNETLLKLSTEAVGVGGIPNLEYAIKNLFNIYSYGGVCDGQIITDASITSSTAILTSASNPFVSTDIGKSIRVAGAASGGDLLTTILSYQSAGQVTLATNASTTISAKIAYFGTDNTTPLQDAIQACDDNKGGVVYAPYVVNREYFFFGALQTSVEGGANPNSQVYIPKHDIDTAGDRISIRILGEFGGGSYGANATTVYKVGVVFRSMILGSGTAPAFLGCSYNLSGGGGTINFTHTVVTIENIDIITRTKTGTTVVPASMTVGDFSKATGASVIECAASVETGCTTTAEPTDTTVTGWKMPRALNTSSITGLLHNAVASGYYNGFEVSDHTYATSVVTQACYNGIYVKPGDGHNVHFTKYYTDGCKYPIRLGSGTGNISFTCEFFSYENNGSGWFARVNHIISESNTTIFGRINYLSADTLSISGEFRAMTINNLRQRMGAIIDSGGGATFQNWLLRQVGYNANSGVGFAVAPLGTGNSATLKSQFSIYNTDVVADADNIERIYFRGAGTSGFVINSEINGTGTLRAINIQMAGSNMIVVNTDGTVSITLPTSNPGAGKLWNNLGIVTVGT